MGEYMGAGGRRSDMRLLAAQQASVPGGNACSIRAHNTGPNAYVGVVGGKTPFGKKLLDIAIGKGESQIPAHRKCNDGRFEVPPFEQGWPRFAH
jgi:hypothetical protein